jgi:hypothetical protein
MSGVHADILYLYTHFRGETKFYVACIKKTKKNVLCVVVLEHQNLSFLHETQKISFFPKNLCANIECLDIHANICFKIF